MVGQKIYNHHDIDQDIKIGDKKNEMELVSLICTTKDI